MATNNTTQQFIDVELFQAQDFILDTDQDLRLVSGKTSILWCLIRRLLIEKGSWAYDRNFGSYLGLLLRTEGTKTVKEIDIREEVITTLQPMLDDGRIEEIKSVSIIERTRSQVTIELVVIISDEPTAVRINIPIT